ncbi:hypothetical protein TNCV_1846191 [Trichonephila clavipes]|nr:hypothetical protein TNCV_1846191 [Trichonephila clavipes]
MFTKTSSPQRSMGGLANTNLTDAHLIKILVDGNARAIERLYSERYPQRDTPDAVCCSVRNTYGFRNGSGCKKHLAAVDIQQNSGAFE